MNIFRVKTALFTLLIHPEHLLPGDRATLEMALHSDDPLEQGIVYEILHTLIKEHAAGRLR
jgi:hypothetical protein